MNNFLITLLFFMISSCASNDILVELPQSESQIIYFDVVEKDLLVEADIPENLELLINNWFDNKIKSNGFEGNMIFKITKYNEDITLIDDGKRVDILLSFEIILTKSSQSKKKFIEGNISSFGSLTGEFSLNDFDNIIKKAQDDIIFFLSQELTSKV